MLGFTVKAGPSAILAEFQSSHVSRSSVTAGVSPPGISDPRRELVRRVVASATFANSRRLRELLLYVCERGIVGGAAVTEREIAGAVFGRRNDFDPSLDTLVRVQTCRLRRKLQLYFAGEGAGEPVVIELERGRYRPAFRDRRPASSGPEPPPGPVPPLHRWRPRAVAPLAAAAAGLLAACLWLLSENRQLRARAHLEPRRPAVERMWRQLFGNGRPTTIVLGDSSLTMFQDLAGVQLSPAEYERKQYALLQDRLTDPVARRLAGRLAKQRYTSAADVSVAAGAILLNAALGIHAEIVHARDAEPEDFRSRNAILTGPRRSNPWLELFEERLNFRSRFAAAGARFVFVNQAPLPGEQPEYAVRWGTSGYCRVAYLPSLDGRGSVLIITGSDMASGEAGATFVTSEAWVRRLGRRLGIAADGELPHFEVLLRTQLVGSPWRFELIAHRVIASRRSP